MSYAICHIIEPDPSLNNSLWQYYDLNSLYYDKIRRSRTKKGHVFNEIIVSKNVYYFYNIGIFAQIKGRLFNISYANDNFGF